MTVLLFTVSTLCALGILAAVVLYVVAQKFKVEEDPRIDEVEKMLPPSEPLSSVQEQPSAPWAAVPGQS